MARRYPRVFGSSAARAQSRAAFTAAGGFFPVLDAALGGLIESNIVTLTNVGSAVPLTISGGSYSKNGGAYSTTATTVSDGDTLRIRVTAPSTNSATATATVSVNSIARSFSVTTPTPTILLDALSISPPLVAGTPSTGNAIMGASGGSTIISNAPGVTVNSAARTLDYDGSGVAGAVIGQLSESAPNATNSPRGSDIKLVANSITITFSPPQATVGNDYSASPTVTGATGTLAFALSGGTLPAGLAFSTTTGAISGKATTSTSVANLVVTVTADNGSASTAPFTLNVSAGGAAGSPVVTTAPAISGTAGEDNMLVATNGTWTNSPTGYIGQWYADSAAISGAIFNSYPNAARYGARKAPVELQGNNGTDPTHPNGLGYQYWGEYIANFIKSKGWDRA